MSEFLNQLGEFLKTPAGTFALLALAVFGAVGLLLFLKETRRYLGRLLGHPTWGDVVISILPYVDQAIVAAFKASEKAADAFGDRLGALDKAAIAVAVYSLLPTVKFGPFVWCPKDHITELEFQRFVEVRFDELIELWTENAGLLLEKINPRLYKALFAEGC